MKIPAEPVVPEAHIARSTQDPLRMYLPSEPGAAGPADQQDLVNALLAAALQAVVALSNTSHAAAVLNAAAQPQPAADLTTAAHALTQIRDMLLSTADDLAARGHSSDRRDDRRADG